MTSAPDSVRGGELVTFDLKITNRSQCPVATPVAEILAFIPETEFLAELSGGGLPPDVPPGVVQFFEQLRMFFDELCSGGEPDLPEPPMFSTSCHRGEGEIVCTMSGPLGAHEGGEGSLTLASLGNRLRCEVDDGTVSCELRLPLPNAPAAASGGGALATKSLSCLTASDLGEGPSQSGALCFVGTIPNIEGLDPGEMATGQVMLPARGEGFVRNIVIGLAGGGGIGVCKGGGDAGKACDPTETDPCPGSTCGEGICVGGPDEGKGCDEASAMTDCDAPGTCELCTDVPETDFLPIDCTRTYIAPETVPAMSPWGLVSLAALLFASGSLWLRRRGRGERRGARD